ncbi:hypothetical protein Xoosp13_367 [Xanthomonas phage Xoo-sp13]|nr:hypothetical protein Xoosp13_367 [Xanthomonas phage Xoo-sp13]
MGLYMFSRSGDYDPPPGNPVPDNFKIIEWYAEHNNCAIRINYPDSDNYEGNKILVFLNTKISTILDAKVIDPHFSDDGSLSPFARFEPTIMGWIAAKNLVNIKSNLD